MLGTLLNLFKNNTYSTPQLLVQSIIEIHPQRASKKETLI